MTVVLVAGLVWFGLVFALPALARLTAGESGRVAEWLIIKTGAFLGGRGWLAPLLVAQGKQDALDVAHGEVGTCPFFGSGGWGFGLVCRRIGMIQ